MHQPGTAFFSILSSPYQSQTSSPTSPTKTNHPPAPVGARAPFHARPCILPRRAERLKYCCHLHRWGSCGGRGGAVDGRRPPRRRCARQCRRPSRLLLRRGGRRGMAGMGRLRDRARIQVSIRTFRKRKRKTYPNREPRAHKRVLRTSYHTPRVLNHTMNCKGWQSHTSNTLEHSALRHNHAIVLSKRDLRSRPGGQSIVLRRLLAIQPLQRACNITRGHSTDNLVLRKLARILVRLAGRHESAPVAQVRLVTFMADIA